MLIRKARAGTSNRFGRDWLRLASTLIPAVSTAVSSVLWGCSRTYWLPASWGRWRCGSKHRQLSCRAIHYCAPVIWKRWCLCLWVHVRKVVCPVWGTHTVRVCGLQSGPV